MKHNLKWGVGLMAYLVLGVLTGCLPAPESTATPTDGITNTPIPITDTPQPTPSPFSFPATIEVPSTCAGSPASRLILGERARVTEEDPTDLNVRSEPGANLENVPIGKLRVGDVVVVVDGPACADGYTWYEVDTGDIRGWIAEGDDEAYYIEPFLGQ